MKATTENKELFTAGEWKISNSFDDKSKTYVPAYYVIAPNVACELSILPSGYGFDENKIQESANRAKANASLIAESKNMYYALQEFLKVINRSEAALYHYGDAIKNAEEIINRINKQ